MLMPSPPIGRCPCKGFDDEVILGWRIAVHNLGLPSIVGED
jgi:hypothetical protein